MKAVLDANIYISAFLKPSGLQSQILKKTFEGIFEIVLSESIFLEICRVLKYPRISKKNSYTEDEIKRLLQSLVEIAAWTSDSLKVKACIDPADDIYLSCSQESQADVLVSGDQHLLILKNFKKTKIITPREFWTMLESI